MGEERNAGLGEREERAPQLVLGASRCTGVLQDTRAARLCVHVCALSCMRMCICM